MDGNASDENEDFLIASMKIEVPESLKQITKITSEINKIERTVQ